MNTFKSVSQSLLNYALSQRQEGKRSSLKGNRSILNLTGVYYSKQFNQWMMRRFEQLISSQFYEGISEVGINKEQRGQEQQKIEEKRRIWQLFDQQIQSLELSVSQSEDKAKQIGIEQINNKLDNAYFTRNNLSRSVSQSEDKAKQIGIEQINNKLDNAYFTSNNLSRQRQSHECKSFITRFYDQQLSQNSSLMHQTNSTTYIADWSKTTQQNSTIRQKYPKLTIVNPISTILSKVISLHSKGQNLTNQLTLQNQRNLLFTKPSSILLTSSSLLSLLSTISLTHLLFYWDRPQNTQRTQGNTNAFQATTDHVQRENQQRIVQREAYKRVGKRQITKIITTKQIYDKYLQLFKFLRLIALFIDSQQYLINSLKSLSQPKVLSLADQAKMLQLIQQLDDKYQALCKEHSQSIENKLDYILSNYYFQIIKPQQHFTYNNLQLCFRNHNLFPYFTYDLEVFNQNGNFIALIQEKHLKNVKNIYYTHKKGFITQDSYHNIIKRLQEKQSFLKNHQNNISKYFSSSNNSVNVKLGAKHQIAMKYMQIQLSRQRSKKLIKKTSLLHPTTNTNSSTKKQPPTQSSSTDKIFNDPYSIAVQTKNNIFSAIRRVQSLSLLSDTDIHQIVQQGVLLSLNEDQFIYHPTMKFEYLFVVLEGICEVKHKALTQKYFIHQRNLFGWKHFVSNTTVNTKTSVNINTSVSKELTRYNKNTTVSKEFTRYNKNTTVSKELTRYQNQFSREQMQATIQEQSTTFTVYSQKATLLRIQLNFLKYLLFDKIPLIQKPHFSELQLNYKSINRDQINKIISQTLIIPNSNFNIPRQIIPILSQQQQLAKILSSPSTLKRLKIFRQESSKMNPHKLNFLHTISDDPLKVLLLNYPNLILIF